MCNNTGTGVFVLSLSGAPLFFFFVLSQSLVTYILITCVPVPGYYLFLLYCCCVVLVVTCECRLRFFSMLSFLTRLGKSILSYVFQCTLHHLF
jgi:hypothetical protein